jgi:hypothetical protein
MRDPSSELRSLDLEFTREIEDRGVALIGRREIGLNSCYWRLFECEIAQESAKGFADKVTECIFGRVPYCVG